MSSADKGTEYGITSTASISVTTTGTCPCCGNEFEFVEEREDDLSSDGLEAIALDTFHCFCGGFWFEPTNGLAHEKDNGTPQEEWQQRYRDGKRRDALSRILKVCEQIDQPNHFAGANHFYVRTIGRLIQENDISWEDEEMVPIIDKMKHQFLAAQIRMLQEHFYWLCSDKLVEDRDKIAGWIVEKLSREPGEVTWNNVMVTVPLTWDDLPFSEEEVRKKAPNAPCWATA